MRAASSSTSQTDAFRAGFEVGSAVRGVSPEVIFLFCSIHYEKDFPGLFEGLNEALSPAQPIIFGGTGDGIYEAERACNQGVSALALNSDGQVQWAVEIEGGAEADPYSTSRVCGKRALDRLGGKADFAFLMATGKTADGTRLIAGLQSVMNIPIVGGLAGDDRKFMRTYILANGKAYADAVGALIARGAINFLINAGSGWKPVGEPGYIEAAHDNVIERIGGSTALAFMRERMGKTPSMLDAGMVPIASMDGMPGRPVLRTGSYFDTRTGAITVLGGMPVGARVQICEASHADVVGGVDEALRGLPLDTFQPVAALVVSCAGRKWILGDRGQEELQRLQARLGNRLPLAGFPSFGEVGPFRREDGSYTATQFHNVTFVLCLIGA